ARSFATPARRRRARGVRAAGAAALAALTVALLAATTPQKTADSGKIVAEIRDLEERFNKAYESNDLKAYFDFYSDDMTQFYQQGRLDLPDYRKLWEKEIADGGVMEEVHLKDMVIKVGPSSDSAMAAYLIFTKQRHPGGPPTES